MLASIENLQKQKRLAVALLGGALLLITACAVVRFIPSVNDWLAGQPEYMRAIATEIAENIPAEVKLRSPIMMVEGDTSRCRGTESIQPSDSDEVFYMITYSEQAASVCFVVCVRVLADAAAPNHITVTSEMGLNYGRELGASAVVTPAQYHLMTFSRSYLSSLHWRDKTDPFRTEQGIGMSSRQPPTAQTASINLNTLELRAAVAQKHEQINRWLSWLLSVLPGLAALLAFRLARVYSTFSENLRAYEFN
ncbi:MAG: hypothetical protein L0Z53_25165, partial [Acidobacteriales bacterium]|nr:hypothetical protein [Terriglobales bacterium]